MLVGLDERLLHDVPRLIEVAEDSAGVAQRAVLVALHHPGERRLLTGQEAHDPGEVYRFHGHTPPGATRAVQGSRQT
jgi:hypothetical protein